MKTRTTNDYLKTLEYVIRKHDKARTKPTRTELAEWQHLVRQAREGLAR